VLPEPPGGATDPGIAGAIRTAADALADSGAIVTEACPPEYELAVDLWAKFLGSDLAPMLPLLEMLMGDAGKRFLVFTQEMWPPLDLAGYIGIFAQRNHLEKVWGQWFTEYDVLLSPTWSLPAFELGADAASLEGAQRTIETIRSVVPQNFLGLPAAVVPCAVVDGLPVGAQLTARRFGDLTALAAAELIEQALGRITPIDPVR
jgi:amidase